MNDPKTPKTAEKPRRPYRQPKLKRLGQMANVTQKSGATPDAQQPFGKPGAGGG